MLGIVDQAEMLVHLLADAVGHILHKQRGQIPRPVSHTRSAKSPLQILHTLEPRPLRQQGTVRNAPGNSGILAPQKTHHRLHHRSRRQHIVAMPPAGSPAQPVGSKHPVHQFDAQIGLNSLIALRLQIALQHSRCGIRRVQLGKGRCDKQKFHTLSP